MEDYNNLKFASLFHDIGKFYQRADNLGRSNHAYDSNYDKLDKSDYGNSGAHSKWSADFVKDNFDELVEDLVLYHHNPSKSMYPDLCKILQKADHHRRASAIQPYPQSFPAYLPEFLTQTWQSSPYHDNILPALCLHS